ncbi:AAA family ATPase [Variovorax sp. OV329]|uniref:AAA family ATPase n=1 Tax=Variovorax sp. OV329 TaxID=1882825 RepID=UPI0008DF818C|nr:AAA family ATPase [Variovorax sp. OV329]SFM82594.1 SAM domain (Sterile alpha motif) [Variovorax sp. OV329]
MAPERDLAQWLQSLGLGAHAESFRQNDVGFDVLRHLSDADLKELGLSLGQRRLLMAALHELHVNEALSPAYAGAPKPAHGERRQITVMFCDLVGSTEMSARLDLDDLRKVLHDYYTACSRIIEESGGFIARIVGDGVLAYFGYPKAQEDAAERAVRASLKIVETFASEDERFKVRIGLATGLSVISDMVGSGFSERHTATGLTPNLAARIQSLAAPGCVAIADETRRLAGGVFTYADMGTHLLQGLDKPVQVWRVLREAPSGMRFEAHRTEIRECLGRDAELDAIGRAWHSARAGRGGIVMLVGEAGIGKSRLLRTAAERFAPHAALEVLLQCAPNQTTAPLHPLIAWLRREIHSATGDPSATPFARLGAWLGEGAGALDLPLVADLLDLPLPEGVQLPAMPPDRKHRLTREALLRHFERHCNTGAVLFMLEDAHWMDGATEAFLRALFEHMQARPFLALITSRPPVTQDFRSTTTVTEVRLDPLKREDAQQLVHNVCHGKLLPAAVLDQILARTDGVPLFIEELTATVLESGLLRPQGESLVIDGPLPALDIPTTQRDSLMARLDRLNDAKEVARIASALGREFSFTLLHQVTGHPPGRLIVALDRLVEAQLLFRRGVPPHADYVFKHALVQQAAYGGQMRGERQALHTRIIEAIELHEPGMASREPGLMAHHCQEANLPDREADYLYAAGVASTRIVAIAQALSYFTRAERIVAELPRTPRNARRHIDVILGLMEVGRFAVLPKRLVELGTLARNLAPIAGADADPATMSSILFQEGRAHLYSSRYARARQIFTEVRELGRADGSPLIELRPGAALAMALCCQGRFSETLAFVDERSVEHYKSSGSFIDYISCLGWIAYARCQVGGGDEGLQLGHQSLQEAELVQSPVYVGGAAIWRSHAFMALRRHDEAIADARRCLDLSQQHAVPYLGWHALIFLALCLCRSGRLDEAERALTEARTLLAAVSQGEWSLLDYLPAIEAELACMRGDHARALAAAEQAIALAGTLGGEFSAVIAWRVKAMSSLATGLDPARAQAMFDEAVRLCEAGGAHAELCFGTLVWAQALQRQGHDEPARAAADAARALAGRYGFDLRRCEFGAAGLLALDEATARA